MRFSLSRFFPLLLLGSITLCIARCYACRQCSCFFKRTGEKYVGSGSCTIVITECYSVYISSLGFCFVNKVYTRAHSGFPKACVEVQMERTLVVEKLKIILFDCCSRCAGDGWRLSNCSIIYEASTKQKTNENDDANLLLNINNDKQENRSRGWEIER